MIENLYPKGTSCGRTTKQIKVFYNAIKQNEATVQVTRVEMIKLVYFDKMSKARGLKVCPLGSVGISLFAGFLRSCAMNFKRMPYIIIGFVFLLIWGCSENSLNFQVRYAEVLGLKQGDPVYFDQNEIGKVKKVFYTKQADYLVEVSIAPDFVNAVTEDSRFFIDADPKAEQGKAVIVLQEKPGGKILKNNAIVQGSVKPGLLDDMISNFQRNSSIIEHQIQESIQQLKKNLNSTSRNMEKGLADSLDDLSQQLNTVGNEFKKIPDREEVQKLKKSFENFAEEFNRAQKNVREQMQNEIIPELRRELDQIRKQLHEEGRDKEIEEIDKKVKELDRA